MLNNEYLNFGGYDNLEEEGKMNELEVRGEPGTIYREQEESPFEVMSSSSCRAFVGNGIYDNNDMSSKHLVFNHDGNKFIYISYDIFTSTFNCK
jgi:hypothetical protein